MFEIGKVGNVYITPLIPFRLLDFLPVVIQHNI